MNLNIEGNPGTGNRFDHIHMQDVNNYTPNARKVENNHTIILHVSLFSIHINGTMVATLLKVLKRQFKIRRFRRKSA